MSTGVFIVPRASTAWRGNEAGWITASGWAAAGQELFGQAVVATADGVFTPAESRIFPRGVASRTQHIGPLRKLIPEVIITALKDLRLYNSKPTTWPIENSDALKSDSVKLIWERHDLFPGPGRRLADKLRVPLVISVEAPVVWEANKWGVRRPVWGRWLERGVEARSLKGADLVTCVSEEVMIKVCEMGVPQDRLMVNPNRVDSTVFHPNIDGTAVHNRFQLGGKKVIGWTGSFRNFHGLDSVMVAFSKVLDKFSNAVLMLVGDGLEFNRIRAQAHQMGIDHAVIFAGRQPFTSVPEFVANFGIALVSASSSEGFHYSPLKLREYLATGKPVVAPRAGDLPRLFEDGKDVLFYEPGDADDLAAKMIFLMNNTVERRKLSEQAQRLFEKEGTWVSELRKVCDKLNIGIAK